MPPQRHTKAVQSGTDSLVSCMPGEDFHPRGEEVRVYAVGSGEEVTKLAEVCQQNHWQLRVVRRIGRPGKKCDVQKILNAYSRLRAIRAVARELGMNPGPVFRVLEAAGVLPPRKGLTKRSKNG